MKPLRTFLAALGLTVTLFLASCGGGNGEADGKRFPLTASATNVPAEVQEELYQFFAIAFGAAPGVTYWGQLVEAAQAGMSVQRIVNVFTTKPQFTDTYPEAAISLAEMTGATYPQLADPGGTLYSQTTVPVKGGLPQFIVLDADGQVVGQEAGGVDELAEVEALVTEKLGIELR